MLDLIYIRFIKIFRITYYMVSRQRYGYSWEKAGHGPPKKNYMII